MADYDEKAIRNSLITQWEGDDLYILPYSTKRSGKNNGITDFILAFKEGDPQAVDFGIKLIVEAAESSVRVFQKAKCGYILAAPPHSVGKANTPSEAACKAVAEALRIRHLFGRLKRIEAVRKAAWAPAGQRPTYFDHLRTIEYDGPDLMVKGKGVILFDDVLTQGYTSMACKKIITDTTNCSNVIGIFLGRTQR